jgi:hypothetical protein
LLTATPAFGGIDVNWTYPTTNPHALAYTILYRSILPEFNQSLKYAEVSGGFFYDKVNVGLRYYYWIEFVSVNGTHGEVIGPATALARPLIQDLIEELTGKIDMGVLAMALKTEILRIQPIDDRITGEIENRLEDNELLQGVIAQLGTQLEGAMVIVQNETTARTEGDSALVNQINVLAAGVGPGVVAAVTEERNLRVAADTAIATDVVTLFTRVNQADAAVITERDARVTADGATATQITDLYAKTAVVNGATTTAITAAIQSEATARSNADGALASDITTLFTKAGQNTAAIESEATARVNAVSAETSSRNTQFATVGPAITSAVNGEATARASAISAAVQTETNARAAADNVLSGQITTAQSTLNGQIAAVQTNLQTNIDTVNGKTTAIGALYTVKFNVNGLIGGFGAYNDGTTVQAGFDVDSFWVGRTGANMRKPFIISGQETFIDEAVINKLTFSKLRDESGSFIVENGKVKVAYLDADNIIAKQINISPGYAGVPRTLMTGGLTQVFDSNNVLRVRMGVW